VSFIVEALAVPRMEFLLVDLTEDDEDSGNGATGSFAQPPPPSSPSRTITPDEKNQSATTEQLVQGKSIISFSGRKISV
jgi:hypothetical protein